MAKDFSPANIGRRLRIPLTVYQQKTKTFKAVPNVTALVTVQDEREQRRLWQAIEQAIERGDWRNDRVAGSADSADAAPSHV